MMASRNGTFVIVLGCIFLNASAFSSLRPTKIPLYGCTNKQIELTHYISHLMSTVTSDGPGDDSIVMRKDKNGKDIVLGSVVRVVTEKLKAHHISKKGFGTFDETQKFIPAVQDLNRGLKNLSVPVGLRGVVTKVYAIGDISANLPIAARFEPGENTDEGYDPPCSFVMHFQESEVECV